MPQDEGLYAAVIARFMGNRPEIDAVFLNDVCPGDPVWSFDTNTDGAIRRNWIVRFPEGARELHTIALSADFDACLRKFSGQTRSTLKRKLRQMKERSNGAPELVRINREDQIQGFLDRAACISQHSWQFRRHGTLVFTTPGEVAAFELLRGAACCVRAKTIACSASDGSATVSITTCGRRSTIATRTFLRAPFGSI